MAGSTDQDVMWWTRRASDADVAALRARVDDLSGALEHVLDVLETLAQSQEAIDWHVEEARSGISRRR